MQYDVKNARKWQSDVPCQTLPIECPDGSTHLVSLPARVWDMAAELLNSGAWEDFNVEVRTCFYRAKRFPDLDGPVTIALERQIHGHIWASFDPSIKPYLKSVSFHDL